MAVRKASSAFAVFSGSPLSKHERADRYLRGTFGHPNRCGSHGHARTARKSLHLVIRRISLVSEQARMGRMLRDEHL
jgi:hypothetical protein